MRRLQAVGLMLLVLAATDAIAASAAQAEEAPFWQIEGTRLTAGKTREFLARSEEGGLTNTKKFVIKGAVESITCEKQTLAKGAKLIGSNAGEPGTSEEVVELRGCTVTGNGEKCKVSEPIKTNTLKEEEVLNTAKTAVLGYYKPASGQTIAELKFEPETGGKCTFASTKLTGGFVGAYLTDGSGEGLLGAGEAKSWLIEFPVTALRKVWLIKAGVGSEVEVSELLAFGGEATLTGTSLLALPGEPKWR
jgi:hypothetical protein